MGWIMTFSEGFATITAASKVMKLRNPVIVWFTVNCFHFIAFASTIICFSKNHFFIF